MADQSPSEPVPDHRPRPSRLARLGRLTAVRRSCGCRRPAAGRPGCMRLRIPRVHIQV
ncbi:MAG: hypothetical protein ABSC16_07390 [Candidatus Dormibacteria bacterium]